MEILDYSNKTKNKRLTALQFEMVTVVLVLMMVSFFGGVLFGVLVAAR